MDNTRLGEWAGLSSTLLTSNNWLDAGNSKLIYGNLPMHLTNPLQETAHRLLVEIQKQTSSSTRQSYVDMNGLSSRSPQMDSGPFGCVVPVGGHATKQAKKNGFPLD